MFDYKDSMAVDGVLGEPLPGLNSLLTGKNTGKFANFTLRLRLLGFL
jgi:hypothetical protein